jgi:hypothetical protein
VGKRQEELSNLFPGKVEVTPYDLAISYDVKMKDGSIPNGPAALWVRLYDILAKNPQVSQQFDMVRIFEYVASLM